MVFFLLSNLFFYWSLQFKCIHLAIAVFNVFCLLVVYTFWKGCFDLLRINCDFDFYKVNIILMMLTRIFFPKRGFGQYDMINAYPLQNLVNVVVQILALTDVTQKQ